MRYKRLFIQDVGGLPAAGDREVRKNLLYRSGELYRLPEQDLDLVRRLGIKQVFDLRQAETVKRRPDDYEAPEVRRMPVRMGEFEDLTLQAAMRRQVDWSRYHFRDLYVIVLEQNQDYIRSFLELLTEGPHPALVHCTAGKDRTGVFVALLLLSLQVPRDRIMRWYLSAGAHLKRNTPRRARFMVWYTRTPRETLMLNVPAMEALFTHLDNHYGGIEGFLGRIGFDRLDLLRAIFLA